MRENSRSIAWGRRASIDDMFSGQKHYGVFLSTNHGVTWQPTALDEFALWGGPEAGSAQVNIVVTNGNGYITNPLVLAGTSSGQVWYSTDHGTTWCIAGGLPGTAVMDLTVNGGTVYAATYGNGIYSAAATGFGTCSPPPTFSQLTTNPCGTGRVMKIAFGPSGGLYACTDSAGTSGGGVYTFVDNTWLDRSNGLPSGIQGYGALAFGLDGQVVPGVGDELWVGSISGSGLWYSAYRGDSWEPVPCYPCGTVLDIEVARDYKPATDTTPNQHIYWGTDWGWSEGFFSMGDSSFVCESRYPAGLSVNSVVPDPDWLPTDPVVWLATSDGIRRVGPGEFPAPPDDPIAGDDLSRFDISYLVPSPSYGNSISDGLVFAASEQFGVFRSIDNGETYHKYMPSLDEATGGSEVSHPVTGLAIHPLFNAGSSCGSGTSSVFMSVDGMGVFRSDAGGSLWNPMNAGLPALAAPAGFIPVTHIAHTPLVPPDGYDFLFASLKGTPYPLYRFNSHDDPGQFWKELPNFPSGIGDITSLVLPPNHDGTTNRGEVWVGTESGLAKSSDRGSTWSTFATISPNSFGPITAIAFHPSYNTPLGANKVVFIGRKGSGVFRTMDGGNTWQAMNNGLYTCSGTPTYSWNFGDGQTSTAQTPSHSYSAPGTYTWTLAATFNGQTINRSGTVKVVSSAGCGLLKGDASATPSVGLVPLTVDFEAAATASGCTGPVNFAWSFGDGSPVLSGKRVAHTYRSAGTFNWSLTMTVDAETFTSTGQITVVGSGSCPWTCRATANPPTVTVGPPVSFTGAAQPYLDVSSLALSPTFASDQTVVVGLNDPMVRDTGGVFVSTNQGTSWSAKNVNLPDRHVKSLAFAKPVSFGGSRLLCGTQRMRAFYTDQPGLQNAPWIAATGYTTAVGEIRAVVVSPVPTNFGCTPGSQAGTDVFAGGNRGVFWSNDGGETFRPINEGFMVAGTSSACVPMTVNCLQLFVNPDHLTSGDPTPMLLAGTEGYGIWYRYATRTGGGAWEWTNGVWQQSNVGSGHSIKRFARERAVFPLRAAGSSGVWTSPGETASSHPYGEFWENSGLAGVTDIRHGQEGQPLRRGVPNPDAPSGGSVWGTISGTGVAKGTQTQTAMPKPAAITWEFRNGTPGGVGQLADKSVVQSVIQLTSGTILTGTTDAGSGLWRTEDEGTVYWETSLTGLEGTSHDVRDFLEVQADTRTPPNYDVFCAVNGSGVTEGGVYLSGDDGRHWVSISNGFDSGEQTLSSIVASEGDPPTYYAGTYTKGSYATTITAEPFPAVTGLSSTSGPSTGGGTISITGTGFQDSCPDGYGCLDGSSIAVFGGVDAPTTFVSATQLTATVPAHPGGAVTVSVRNPDTRSGSYSTPFTYTEAEGGSPEFKVTVTRNGSNEVVATWENAPTSGIRKIFRSPVPDFSVQLDTRDSSGTSGSQTYSDSTGTNAHMYFYKVE
jgi:PKD repeat protein